MYWLYLAWDIPINNDVIFAGEDDNFEKTVLYVSILTTLVLTGVVIGLVKTYVVNSNSLFPYFLKHIHHCCFFVHPFFYKNMYILYYEFDTLFQIILMLAYYLSFISLMTLLFIYLLSALLKLHLSQSMKRRRKIAFCVKLWMMML